MEYVPALTEHPVVPLAHNSRADVAADGLGSALGLGTGAGVGDVVGATDGVGVATSRTADGDGVVAPQPMTRAATVASARIRSAHTE